MTPDLFSTELLPTIAPDTPAMGGSPALQHVAYWQRLAPGDWRHPGVYCLRHLPTGLEYIGASSCVRQRIQSHFAPVNFSEAPSYRLAYWAVKLRLCIAVQKAGRVTVMIPGDRRNANDRLLHLTSFEQVYKLKRSLALQALEVLAMKGGAEPINSSHMRALWLRTCPPDNEILSMEERRTIQERRPLLNGLNLSTYPSANDAWRTSAALQEPPAPMTDSQIKAIPIAEALLNMEENDRLQRNALWRQQLAVETAIRRVAMKAANETYARVIAELSADINA
jgi:hypothetical protein